MWYNSVRMENKKGGMAMKKIVWLLIFLAGISGAAYLGSLSNALANWPHPPMPLPYPNPPHPNPLPDPRPR